MTPPPQGRRLDGRAPGRIRLGALIFLLLLASGVYLTTKYVPPYWTYLSMQDPVREAAMGALMPGGEERARDELIRRAKEQGLKLTQDNIVFTREGPLLVLRVTWVEPVDLPRTRHNLRFRIEQSVPLR